LLPRATAEAPTAAACERCPASAAAIVVRRYGWRLGFAGAGRAVTWTIYKIGEKAVDEMC
jgi:hypothetical protein